MKLQFLNSIKYCLFISCIAICLGGCNVETWKRAAYETGENMRQQQCTEQLESDCSKREDYEKYQRNKSEVYKKE